MGQHDRRADLVGVEVDPDHLRRLVASTGVVVVATARPGQGEDATDRPDRGLAEDEEGRRRGRERRQLARDGRPGGVVVPVVEVQAPCAGRHAGHDDRPDPDRAVADAQEHVRHVLTEPLRRDDRVGDEAADDDSDVRPCPVGRAPRRGGRVGVLEQHADGAGLEEAPHLVGEGAAPREPDHRVAPGPDRRRRREDHRPEPPHQVGGLCPVAPHLHHHRGDAAGAQARRDRGEELGLPRRHVVDDGVDALDADLEGPRIAPDDGCTGRETEGREVGHSTRLDHAVRRRGVVHR
jgi:hypothetical protein